jgi:hypothetical protein
MRTGTAAGRVFREAWIAGVKKHFPGEPKSSYIVPWADSPTFSLIPGYRRER